MTSTEIQSRELQVADLSAIAEVHRAAFPRSLITRLGPEAVRRYYAWQLLGPHEVDAEAAFLEGRLVGYCFGGVFRGAMSGYLRANRGYLACCLLRRPWIILEAARQGRLSSRLVRRVLRSGATEDPSAVSTPSTEPVTRPFGILAIAVDPRTRRAGVGRLLMNRMESAARHRGRTVMELTVHPSNRSAVAFYEQLGWCRVERANQWSGLMRKAVEPAT